MDGHWLLDLLTQGGEYYVYFQNNKQQICDQYDKKYGVVLYIYKRCNIYIHLKEYRIS